MGYQKKGYTSGEIATAWIEDFDKLTKVKATGRYRLLVVDGHSLHFTMGFLNYALTFTKASMLPHSKRLGWSHLILTLSRMR
jgi:hypothetical protein